MPRYRLMLPQALYDDMIAQAQKELPNECVGFFAGTIEEGVGRVQKRYPLSNALSSPTEYMSDSATLFAAHRDMRQRNIDILAIYHSHPTSAPIPSRKDIERNNYPDKMHIIVSLKDGKPEARIWWLGADGYQEAEWDVVVGIDPKVDYAFKHLFGREESRPLLIDLINSVLMPPPGHEVVHVELLNPFNPKEALDDKLSVLDVKARDQQRRQFNVEMQMLPFPDYEKRILFYWAKLHQQQLREGQDYGVLRPTISISFLNHKLLSEAAGCHTRFRLHDDNHGISLTEDMELHMLELPKFTKSRAELTSGLDNWLYFLRHTEKMEAGAMRVTLQQRPQALRALEEVIMLSQTDLEREKYEARRKGQLDHNTRMKAAREEGLRTGLQEGLQLGLQEGRQQGIQEGRAQGIQEGRQEGRERGAVEGSIRLCERILRVPESAAETLAALTIEQLQQLASELEKKVLEQ